MSYDAPPPPPGDPTPEPGATPDPYGAPPPPPAADYPPPPPPPPAGYPPPPPSYPPPAMGYGGPGPSGADPVAAIKYGWSKFTQNVGSILVAVIIYVVVLGVIDAIWYVIVGKIVSGSGFIGILMVEALGTVVFGLLGYVVQAGIARAALAFTDGRPVTMDLLFTTDQLANVILTGLLLSIATAIGVFLCFIPGIIVAFLGQFAIFFVVDKRLAPVEAITASFRLVTSNLGAVVIFFLLSILVVIVGVCAICIGLLVAIPVLVIGQAYMFRQLQNEPVTA